MRDFFPTLLICAGLAAVVFGLQAALSMASADMDRAGIVASIDR